MASYTVKAGDSWASIAGAIYNNQRWLLELASANGGINRILHPGDVIEAPDFDTSQTPVITNDQWASVPTGMTGNTTNYGNAGAATGPAVPSFKPPAVPSFGTTGTNGKAVTSTTGQSEAYRAQNYAKPYDANAVAGIPRGSAMDAQLRTPITSRIPTDQYTGVPAAARAPGASATNPTSARSINSGRMTRGNNAANPTPTAPVPPSAARYSGLPGAVSAANQQQRPAGTQGPFQTSQGAIHQGASSPTSPYNAANPGPVPSPASDRSNIAWAARWIGGGITDYARTGRRDSLPKTINARVAQELPWYDAGYASAEEYLAALGYQMGADGNWQRYDPQRRSGYSGQTYAASSGGGGGGGGGYDYSGYSRGPAYGYGTEGLGLVNWRIG